MAGLNRPCASASRDTRPYFILKFHHFRYLFFIDDHTSNCARTDAFYLCIYGRAICSSRDRLMIEVSLLLYRFG